MKRTAITRSTQLVQTNPIDLWRSKVALGEIGYDREQLATLTRLKGLHAEISSYTPPLELLRSLSPIRTVIRTQSGWQGMVRRWTLGVDEQEEKQTAVVRSLTGSEALEALQTPKGVLLYGDPGSGKSMILDIWYGSLPTTRKLRLHYHAFMTLVYGLVWEESLKRQRGAKERHRIDYHQSESTAEHSLMMHTSIAFAVARRLFLNHGHILYLDELQMVDIASAVLLRDTLSWFLRFGGVLLSTSNKPPSELYAKGVRSKNLNDFLYALERRCDGLRVDNGVDHRTTKESAEMTSWVVGHRDEFEEMVKRELGDDKNVAARTLSVYGREVIVKRSNGNTAMFTFAELCDSPLGPSDYLALSSTFSTIIIDQVPVLHLAQKNQARRFITLIDALYESKCRLIAYAEDEVTRLFFPSQNTHASAQEADDVIAYEAMSESIELQSSPHVSSAGTLSGKFTQSQNRPAQHLHGLAVLSGEDEKFAYRRAVSRLVEMQSKSYLSAFSDSWKSLPQQARVWERSSNATKSIEKLAEIGNDKDYEFGDEFSNTGGFFQRDNAPVLSDSHIWGVREDHGMGTGEWGMGSRAYEDTDAAREEIGRREQRKSERLTRRKKEFKG